MILDEYQTNLIFANILSMAKYIFSAAIDKVTYLDYTMSAKSQCIALEHDKQFATITKFPYTFTTEYNSRDVSTNNLIICMTTEDDFRTYFHYMSYDNKLKFMIFKKNPSVNELRPIFKNNVTLSESIKYMRSFINMSISSTNPITFSNTFKRLVNDKHMELLYETEELSVAELSILGMKI